MKNYEFTFKLYYRDVVEWQPHGGHTFCVTASDHEEALGLAFDKLRNADTFVHIPPLSEIRRNGFDWTDEYGHRFCILVSHCENIAVPA